MIAPEFHPHRCGTCKNGFLYTRPTPDKKSTFTVYVCSKAPYKAPFLDELWAYIDKKGCDQWIDKDPKPLSKSVKKPELNLEKDLSMQLPVGDTVKIVISSDGTVIVDEGKP